MLLRRCCCVTKQPDDEGLGSENSDDLDRALCVASSETFSYPLKIFRDKKAEEVEKWISYDLKVMLERHFRKTEYDDVRQES